MRHSLICSLVVYLVGLGLPCFAAEPANPPDKSSKQESSSSARASKEEVEQLRGALAAQQKAMESQQKTIEELKSMVSAMAQRMGTTDAHVLPAAGTQGAHVQTLAYGLTPATEPSGAVASSGQTPLVPQKSPEKKPSNALEWTVGGTKVQIYGHSDVSYDYVDNGISRAMEATNPLLGPTGAIRGNNGWLGQLSSNLSYFGIRGSHKINDYLTGVFQFESEVMMTATPGPTSDLQCKYCLGSRDTFVGVSGPWGAIKMGKEDAPYKKTTTGAFDPFLNSIGDARSIMGNSGGDNRAEFMGRVSHAIWYESPTYKGLSASLLFSPGQNRSSDNGGYPRGEPNCAGGNGAFTLSLANKGNVPEGADLNSLIDPPDINPCNDGAFGNVVSASVTYRGYGLYAFTGYEHHGQTNRTGDLVGVADESAWKAGLEYTFKKTGTTPSFVYEKLKRYGATSLSAAIGQPLVDPTLNERSRPNATWLALRQKLTNKDTWNCSWIYSGKTPGDPGNCSPEALGNCPTGGPPFTPVNTINNSSNMYAVGVKHTLSRNMSTYFVYARQANHADAHYDLGAVGHGIVVDKKDFLGTSFNGTRLQGLSGGLTFDF
ncbi:MAG: porin [Terriglobales bacterium]